MWKYLNLQCPYSVPQEYQITFVKRIYKWRLVIEIEEYSKCQNSKCQSTKFWPLFAFICLGITWLFPYSFICTLKPYKKTNVDKILLPVLVIWFFSHKLQFSQSFFVLIFTQDHFLSSAKHFRTVPSWIHTYIGVYVNGEPLFSSFKTWKCLCGRVFPLKCFVK